MRLLFALAVLAVPFAASPAHTPEAPAPAPRVYSAPALSDPLACANNNLHLADKKDWIKPEAKRLGELPAGNLVLTVVRYVAGCQEPVIVREGYGFGAPQAAPPEMPRARRW